jgi:transposase-like protein
MPVNSFKWKHYAGEIILLNVRWYLKYALSYRNLQEMMAERGVKVDHTTIRLRCKNNFAAFIGYNYCFLYYY